MSHFAELKDNKVIRVLKCDNNDPNGDEGYQWLIDTYGGTWIQTSYSSSFKYNFAGIGFTYDPITDAFIPPAPCNHEELLLNELKRWECSNHEHDIKEL
jgi:hypothetical protein